MQRFANVLKGLGVGKGDRVAIYMPMIPELPVAMLACARIGAPHSVVFGGFSADSLADRINDAEGKVLVTADGGFRRGQAHLLKPIADMALASTPSIEHVVVVDRVTSHVDAGGVEIDMTEGRDLWYHDLMDQAARCASPSAWTAKTCCTCCTRRAPRPSPRASCTRPAATSRRSRSPTSTSSTSSPRATSTGARPTSVG